MDKVQNMTAEYLKKLVSKSNFLTVYDFAVLRGITSLSNFITSTIIKPAEVNMIFISFSSQHLFPSGCTEKEIRSTLKEQEDTVDKEKDRQALIDMFVELVKIDQENAMDYFLTVGGVDIPENTRLQFTKLGKVQVLAIVVLDGYTITEVGSTRKESVNNLALKVRFFFF